MHALQKAAVAVLLTLLVAVLYGVWATYQPAPSADLGRQGTITQRNNALSAADDALAIDEHTLLTAQRLGALASTPAELPHAQAAGQLADHELDLAFAAALRQIEAHPPVLSPAAQKIAERLQKSQSLLESDQVQVAQLTAALAQAADSQKNALQDRLDLAQSQLELDRDEVEEANQDLLQAGGNVHQRIQKMMQEHAAAEHGRTTSSPAGADPLATLHGLVQRLREWLTLRKKQRWIGYAAAHAASSAAQLGGERQKLAAQLEASKDSVPELAHHTKRAKSVTDQTVAGPGTPTASASGSSASAPSASASGASVPRAPARGAPSPGIATASDATLLNTTRQIVADQKLLTFLDRRISDRRQLAEVYGKWNDVVAVQASTVLHAGLLSVVTVIVILLLLMFIDRWLESLLGRTKLDRRQLETLRTVVRVGLQILSVIVILLVLIGLPGQLGTMLGIAGAGLTVALKDFIVAFIGWLVLLGKNGIRLGDWVEINGVSGEVVELGMFHTVLLETGNWTDAGHPTGRRVTFTNSFAIQGHYFNFSTSGQWLWDEVLVLVPYERDPHPIADTLYKEVVDATTESSKQAEHEWLGTASGRRGAAISATPGISIRPAVGGVEIAVRYVTRAAERFGLRARLYKSAVGILGQGAHPRPA
jgi:small-conductance mechanosensitive channel